LPSKNPLGRNMKPTVLTGITGQSSGRTTWCAPIVYQTTTSVPSSDLSPLPNSGKPVLTCCW
jgi:hypothetical protein